MESEYNKFINLPDLPYNIIAKLIDGNDLFWRLLKYNDPNAYKLDVSHPNLTKEQKGLLVYDGLKVKTDCRVFMDIGMEESWQEQCSILRVSIFEVIPSNHVYGSVVIAFEIYTHNSINTLSNYKTRNDMLAQQILFALNGADVSGIGKLYFDASKNGNSSLKVVGASPYKGKVIKMCNWIV